VFIISVPRQRQTSTATTSTSLLILPHNECPASQNACGTAQRQFGPNLQLTSLADCRGVVLAPTRACVDRDVVVCGRMALEQKSYHCEEVRDERQVLDRVD
jgi:hypothetical protein